MASHLHLVLGNQLFPARYLPKGARVYIAEDWVWSERVLHHKQKLALYLSASRHYADELRDLGFDVTYSGLDASNRGQSFVSEFQNFVRRNKVGKITVFEVEDSHEAEIMECALGSLEVEFEVLKSPMFIVSRAEMKDYLREHERPMMKTFYERMRRKTGILMEASKPVGNKFSFDTSNRKKMPIDHRIKGRAIFDQDYTDGSVLSYVNREFPDNPGSLAQFHWATSRNDVMARFQEFLENHFSDFGVYQDAMVVGESNLHHSLISPYLNIGLLTPEDVLREALEFGKNNKIPINSIEGFVRQVLGWREFVRGIYHQYDDLMSIRNFWGHHRTMSAKWYLGSTGMPPLDEAIRKAGATGYVHHIERLMIVANLMNLCEIHPRQAYQWFSEMFVDSADWVMSANVYGMGLMSEGGIFATKPYICGSSYILRMSNFARGEWCDIWDGLYWRFVSLHRNYFENNPRMSVMVKSLDRMDPNRLERIMDLAESFIESVTSKNHNDLRMA